MYVLFAQKKHEILMNSGYKRTLHKFVELKSLGLFYT